MNTELHPWKWAAEQPKRPALIMFDSGRVLTYGEMMAGANRYARLFERLGLQIGDTIAFVLENNATFVQLCWAAENSGLYYVPIGAQLNAADISYIVANSGAKVLVTSLALQKLAGSLVDLISPDITLLMCDGTVEPFKSIEDAAAAELSTPVRGKPAGQAVIYSSGTTGRPKGISRPLGELPPEQPVMSTHRMWTDRWGLWAGTVLMNSGPFYHSMSIRAIMHAQREGATVVSSVKFDAAATLRAIEDYGVTMAVWVPTMIHRMLKLPAAVRDSVDVRSLQCVIHTAAPCPVDVKRAFIGWVGPIVFELYGGSEGVGNTIIDSVEWLAHPGSVGRPAAGTEVHILDEQGTELPANKPGSIFLSNGRHFEYLNDPEKTAQSRNPNGWVTLGDIGYKDEDGYLYLTDRQSNMIISGGVNVYPQEAENILMTHPLIEDVGVIGVPHEDFGETVMAVVVPVSPVHPEDEASFKQDIVDYCQSRLSAYKCPRLVDIVATLPRSDAGKLLKHKIRKNYWPDGANPVV